MQVLRVRESFDDVELATAALPYRHALDKGAADVIPATGFWLARLDASHGLDFHRYGSHLVVVLSGALEVQPRGGASTTLRAGDVLCCDVSSTDALAATWCRDVWVLLVSTPGWTPTAPALVVERVGEPRRGRPSMTWIHDDGDYSRSEPFRWPGTLVTVPDPQHWYRSIGAFVTRRDYGLEGFAVGKWHNGPRRQFAITLNGCAELETSDATVSRPVAGDLTLIDDIVGPGHITRGRGDRWMLFVTVAAGELPMTGEAALSAG